MKILINSDNPNQSTGYGQWCDNFVRQMQKRGHEIFVIGRWQFGAPCWYQGTLEQPYDQPIKLFPRAADSNGFDVTQHYIKRVKPDVFVSIADIGLQNGWVNELYKYDSAKHLRELRQGVSDWKGKWVAYVPYDCAGYSPVFQPALDCPDAVVMQTKWGLDQVSPFAPEDAFLATIPIGVDNGVFKPLPEERRKALRVEMGGEEARMKPDDFVVIGVGRNQIRKMWGYVLKGFAEFAAGKDDVRFLLHTEPEPLSDNKEDGWKLNHLISAYGLAGKAIYTRMNLDAMNRYGIGQVTMNKFYNLADVYGLTSNEGFGVPCLEAMSAGLVPLQLDMTAGPELAGAHGLTVRSSERFVACTGIEWGIPDCHDYAAKLQQLYDSKDELCKRKAESRAFAEGYSWEKVGIAWQDLLVKLTS